MPTHFTLKQKLEVAFSPTIMKRSLKVSIIVGTLLMLINHGDALFNGELDLIRMLKILLTYTVPYLVSTQAGVAATLEQKQTKISDKPDV
jgi:hypothetical protein